MEAGDQDTMDGMDRLAGRNCDVKGLAPGEAVEITESAGEIGMSDRWRTAVLPGRVSLAS